MNFKKMLLFLIAPLAVMMNSCNTPEGPEYTLPIIKVTDVEGGVEINSLSLASEGGNKTFVITSTRGWEITNQAEWLAVNPLKVTNEMLTEQVTTVTLTAPANDGAARTEVLKVKMESKEVSITVTQAGAGQVELGEVLYYDNFDKGGQAQKGSSGWDTYMDQEAGKAFCNPTPENQAGVTYTGTKLTVRSNSSNGSAGTHSNYKGSGMNYLWFGTAPTNLTVSGISLAELEGNALTFSFGTERYEYNATDNTFKPEEFHVYISGDGEKWSEISYTFVEDANTNGKWNEATAQFNLKEVPEKLYIYMTATVGAAYAVDDLKLTAGGGGAEIDLAAGSTIDGLNPGGGSGDNGGGQGSEPDPNAQQVTVQQFLDAEEDDTLYLLTGTISGNVTSHYGNFDLTDETGTVYIYGLVDSSNKFVWDSLGLQVGDTITIQGTRTSYNDTPQMKNALYISHVKGEGNEEPDQPVVADGPYASDAAFVCTTDDSTNCVYTLGESKVNDQAATGFKLGKSKQQGKFTSKAVGVSGDKYLNFYAVSWGAGGDQTIYFRVNGGEAMSQAVKANSGAAGNPPYTITVTDTDHYSVLLSGLSESDVIEFSSNAAFDCATTTDYATRAIFFGVKLTDEPIGGTTETPDPEDPEDPEEPEQPEPSDVATIAEVLATSGALAEGTFVEGVVISNMALNNLTSKKGLYIQDETAGLQFYLAANHEFAFGDKVKIDLSGVTVGAYNGAVQVSDVALDKITKISSGNTVEAKTVSIADFLANKYEGQYVAIEGVQVADADLTKTWVMDGKHTSINIEDANGNKFVVFSSKYATYGAETVAQGSGTLKGIAAINNGTVQIIFGQESDFAGLTGTRFGATVEPEEPETPEEPEQPIDPNLTVATIQQFLDAAESTTQWYQLTGVITSIEKADYGNIYIQDETNSVYIYGLCATKVEKNDKSFSSLGLKVGDTVTLNTLRTSYNGTPQGGGSSNPAYYVSHVEGEPAPEPEIPEGSVVATAVFANMGYSNAQVVDGTTITLDENVSIVFNQAKSGTAPAYYDSGSAIRMYQNGATLDVTANGKTITSIELTFASNMYYIGADCGTLSEEAPTRTWTGEATAVKFTSTGTDKSHRAYVSAIKVTYTE